MILKQTVVDQIEVTHTNSLQIKIGLWLVEDGKIISQKWHRTMVEQGGDVDAQMQAVNNHLVQMGEQPVGTTDIAKIKAIQASLK